MTGGDEADRLREAYTDGGAPWLAWGPYLSERQWGTVREDYSPGGDAWDHLPHDHARSRAYRWGEDGLAGISDEQQRLCFALALWNGRDPILKERLFGLTNAEGNHGEDVKEYYFFLENTPTHSYQKWLYKYPQAEFPYADLVAENRRRKESDPGAFEYELLDTGVFAEDRYFDVQVEYAKAAPRDILVRIRADNRGPEAATLHLLPTLWFRNTWSWLGTPEERHAATPAIVGTPAARPGGVATLRATPAPVDAHDGAVAMTLYCLGPDELLACDNESNAARLWGSSLSPAYPKDGINDHVVTGAATVNPLLTGTKAAAAFRVEIAAGDAAEIYLRLSDDGDLAEAFGADFDETFAARQAEADAFYAALAPTSLTDEERAVQRQAYAGMLWSKQRYYYVVKDWLDGDPAGPPPPAGRTRNAEWLHFYAADVLTMPDTWEYPWFASWDLCFQSVVFARLDVEFAKNQLRHLAREWYMSPDGAVPAYEWAFSDVNPPLHAWAALRILDLERAVHGGQGDADFLADIFQYCLMYFTWWTNRKDAGDNNLFQGGFLGLDNISIIDRSHVGALEAQLGRAVEIYQSDGTSWMGMFSLHLMEMALRLEELGRPEYARLASKFFQHFVFIADAMNSIERRSDGRVQLWDEADGFYYDALVVRGTTDEYLPIALRSLVGIIALFPVASLDLDELAAGDRDHDLVRKIDWFDRAHGDLLDQATTSQDGNVHLLSFVKPDRLRRILRRVLDEEEFLGPHGIRGISRAYLDDPCTLDIEGARLSVRYEPAESSVGLFGGNSNWRGPVWFPVNFLLIETLLRYHDYLGDAFTVEYPTGSGEQHTLREVAEDLRQRLTSTFLRGPDGLRPVHGGSATFQHDPHWQDHLLFYEYFHGDNGAGIGASHQTGWTGLVAELLHGI
jgi:hypothetical protein